MKTAFITGANRGIGLETARQLGKLGYHVILGARDVAAAEKAANALIAEGIKADPVAIDICNEESVKAAADAVQKLTNGVLDVLVNNAGVRKTTLMEPDSLKLDLEAMRTCLEVNYIGTARVGNYFIEMVKASPAGRIVNVSSIMASFHLQLVGLNDVAYNASKAALNMYTVDMAKALQGTKVKINAGHPGWVRTDMGGDDADLSLEEGTETNIYLATLPEDGPTGGYFFKRERLPW